jgi:hypothetical protein
VIIVAVAMAGATLLQDYPQFPWIVFMAVFFPAQFTVVIAAGGPHETSGDTDIARNPPRRSGTKQAPVWNWNPDRQHRRQLQVLMLILCSQPSAARHGESDAALTHQSCRETVGRGLPLTSLRFLGAIENLTMRSSYDSQIDIRYLRR